MTDQGLLDNCEDYFVSLVDLEEAQAPLKPSIRPPATEVWKSRQNYFCNLLVDLIRRIFKYSTQHGVLPSSFHLQKQFKSPNPVLNLHRRNEADTTDQIFSDTPAIYGGKASAHIFVGYDLKITDVYKARQQWKGVLRSVSKPCPY